MRASDRDRDLVADRLREALAEGRLTPEEHSERIEAVYSAKTYAELAPIVADIPTAGGAPAVEPEVAPTDAPPHQSTSIVAVFGGAERKGRWLVEPQTNILCIFGGIELDLRQAVLSQREVTVNIVVIFGGASITVPPGVHIANSITGILGGTSVQGDEEVGPDAPCIRLTGAAIFGGVEIKVRDTSDSKKGRRRDVLDVHERQREIRDLQRQHHRELHERRREMRDLRRQSRDS